MQTTQTMTRAALMTALIAVLSYVSIPMPFSQVPLTLQTLGVMLAALLLTPRGTMTSLTVYLFLGAVGLPIFAGGTGGIGVLLGPTGGFLLSFLIGGTLLSQAKERTQNLFLLVLATVLLMVVLVHVMGAFWLAMRLSLTVRQAALVGSLPYLLGDLIKVAMAIGLARAISNRWPGRLS